MEDNKNKKVLNVPTLRFPEFSGEWTKRKIKNILKCYSTSYSMVDILLEGETPIYDANKLVGYINECGYNEKYIAIIKDGASVGTIRLLPKNTTHISTINGLLSQTENIDFLYFALQGLNFTKYIVGSGIPHIYFRDYSLMNIFVSSSKEQSKIANFLSLIDKRIELQNKIIKDYELLKKELNNKLFCYINNSTPKIRFKNFYEKWAKNKVKNIFESVTRGYVLSKKDISTIKTNIFKYPVYSSQTLNNGLLGYYSNYLYENAITWTTDGANAGEVNFRKDKFYCTNVCGVLLSNNGYCNECMAAIINKVTKKFVSLVGNPKLMNNVMENIEIIFPSNIKEQLKIYLFINNRQNYCSL